MGLKAKCSPHHHTWQNPKVPSFTCTMGFFAKSFLWSFGVSVAFAAYACYDTDSCTCKCPKTEDDEVNVGCYVFHDSNKDLVKHFHHVTNINWLASSDNYDVWDFDFAHWRYRAYGKQNTARNTTCDLPPGCKHFWDYLRNHNDVEGWCAGLLTTNQGAGYEAACGAVHYHYHGKSEGRKCSKNYAWDIGIAKCRWRRYTVLNRRRRAPDMSYEYAPWCVDHYMSGRRRFVVYQTLINWPNHTSCTSCFSSS